MGFFRASAGAMGIKEVVRGCMNDIGIMGKSLVTIMIGMPSKETGFSVFL